MTTVNYPTPVNVNGFSCKNCTDVDYAKKHIDPAHPKDGPYGVDAKDHASSALPVRPAARSPAVTFGGALAGVTQAAAPAQPPAAAQGHRLDISA